MTIKLQKFIDHWIGTPLCTLLALVVRRDPHLRLPAHPQTLLVSKFFGIGSIALQLPLLRALRQQYPGARLVFMTFASNRRLLELAGLCDEILPVRVSARHFLIDCLRALRRGRFLHPDLGIDLEFFSKFAQLMCLCSGAQYRVGLERREFWRRRMYHRMVPITEDDEFVSTVVRGAVANNPATEPPNHQEVLSFRWKHIIDIYGEVARAAGCEQYDEAMVPVALPAEASEAAHRFLTGSGWRAGERLIAVNVNASELVIGRRWPAEKFAELIERVVGGEPADVQVVLTGTSAEFDYTESVRTLLSTAARQRVINAAGKLSLDSFLALLIMCDLLITNDTGPLHLAALMGTPTVSLWGPGAPSMYGPRLATALGTGEPQHVAVYEKYWCSPCMYLYRVEPGTFCNFTFPCVRGLAVEQVKQAVDAVRAQRRDGPAGTIPSVTKSGAPDEN